MLFHYHRYNHRYRSELSVTTGNREKCQRVLNEFPELEDCPVLLWGGGGGPSKICWRALENLHGVAHRTSTTISIWFAAHWRYMPHSQGQTIGCLLHESKINHCVMLRLYCIVTYTMPLSPNIMVLLAYAPAMCVNFTAAMNHSGHVIVQQFCI